MDHLLDTDIVVDWLNGDRPTLLLVSSFDPDGIAISLITYGEIYDGIYSGRDPRRAERGFRGFLRIANVIPLTQRNARTFARLRGDLRRSGRPIGDSDLLIAATAIDRGMVLVTRNRRHFERVPGLVLHEEA